MKCASSDAIWAVKIDNGVLVSDPAEAKPAHGKLSGYAQSKDCKTKITDPTKANPPVMARPDFVGKAIPSSRGLFFPRTALTSGERHGRVAYLPGIPEALKIGEALKVEFYYSSKDEPAKQYYCDTKKALDLANQLQAKGVNIKIQDCGEQPASFMTYNAAVTGPSAARRSVFGTKGALEEDLGRAVPALLIFDKEADRYPVEVYPRMDRELNRLIGIEEALQNLLSKA